ncbi:DUF2911 domain-containing protein [Salisaeta longa]|uniref:DUF2911 domain-containing protein n=1 Tax=Salisaeta longa TaxID=503170 RepID=UPI0003B6FF54|nr:DUF2911 domain-containing protein [Salisaeta longa]
MLLSVGLLLICRPAHAQERGDQLPRVSPNASVTQTIGLTNVAVSYGRPSMRGRTIFGELVPYGAVWRTGANEATTISFSTPVQIKGQSLAAGTYALFTIPRSNTWTIIFNRQAKQWGAYNYDKAEDALRVDVTPQSGVTREMFTVTFTDVSSTEGTLMLHWSDVRVPVPLSVDTPALLAARAAQAIDESTDWQVPLQYAAYALSNDLMPETALQWAEASIARAPHFQNLAVKARLLAQLERYEAAVAAAERALTQAEQASEPPRGVEGLRNDLQSWKQS